MKALDAIIGATDWPYLPRAEAHPFLKWAGGKRKLVPEIAARRPRTINAYWEPFVGGGAVYFALAALTSNATVSDVNAELVLTYKAIRDNPEEVIKRLRVHAEQHCKDYYLSIRAGMPTTSEGVAARLIYLNKTCFNGLYRVNRKGGFNVPMGRYKNPTICDTPNLRAASRVLQDTTIKVGDFTRQVAPEPGDFIYCDPPYDGTYTGYTGNGFGEDDQARLAEQVKEWHQAGAKVMVSNSDTPLIRGLYADFRKSEIQARRNINSNPNGRGPVVELIITTYDPDGRPAG